jgi:hypothetical protein
METMSSEDAKLRFPPERVGPPRRAAGAVVVASVYTLLVLGAPLLVRYGPEPEVSAAVARVAVHEVASPRCANAPEFGRSCNEASVVR